jgi:hypothetical protein
LVTDLINVKYNMILHHWYEEILCAIDYGP